MPRLSNRLDGVGYLWMLQRGGNHPKASNKETSTATGSTGFGVNPIKWAGRDDHRPGHRHTAAAERADARTDQRQLQLCAGPLKVAAA
jgi:hypothetical protein